MAVRSYKKELEVNPGCGEAAYNLGALYFKSRRYAQAAAYFERCYILKHCVNEVVERLAHSYFKTNQLEKEMNLYQECLQRDARDSWSMNNLAAVLMQLGQFNRAQIYLKKALQIAPEDEVVSRNMAKAGRLRRLKKLGDSPQSVS